MENSKNIDPFWKLANPLTVDQAAALIAGIDPNYLDKDGERLIEARVQAAFAALTNAITGGKLKAKLRYDAEPRYTAGIDNLYERSYWNNEDVMEVSDNSGDSYIISGTPNWSQTSIEENDLTTWLNANNIQPLFFFSHEISKEKEPSLPIKGDTFAKLSAAISAFPEEYPQYKEDSPKIDADVRKWLGTSFGCGEREKHVFGQIIREHFDLK